MNPLTRTASATAMLLTVLVASASPAAAVTDEVGESVSRLPNASRVIEHMDETSNQCDERGNDPECLTGFTDRVIADAEHAGEPVGDWAKRLIADPASALAAEAEELAAALAARVDAAQALIAQTLKDLLGDDAP